MTVIQLPPLPEAAKIRRPLTLQIARAFLVFLILAWTGGSIAGARHLWIGIEAQETREELRADVVVLLERLVLAAAAAVSWWAIGHRRHFGRWLTLGLGAIVLFRWLRMLERAWRELHGDLNARLERIAADASPPALWLELAIEGLLVLALIAFLYRLVTDKSVTEYFKGAA